ncbi:N-acetyltransferase family protein [Hoeflea sp.]|uniref:GNAT family N-acetyltransferase n=1 Tax=Hoeflea sp. TaxID=1940281 RepID=UPI003B027E35
MKIRPTKSRDVSALQLVLEGTNLFPQEMLPEMLSAFLSGDKDLGHWLTCEKEGVAIGFCYAAPEQLAEGTWNMLAIAILPEEQGIGAGKALVNRLESDLRSNGQRILIVDTSGTDGFTDTREFYRKNGYIEEARIRDFWAPGDDKVVFWKAL